MDVASFNVFVGSLVLIVQYIFNSVRGYESDAHSFIDLQVDENIARRAAQIVVSTAALFEYRLNCNFVHLSEELKW